MSGAYHRDRKASIIPASARYPWKVIPWAYTASASYPASGYQWINNADHDQQFDVSFHPHGTPEHPYPHVQVSVLVDREDNRWEVRSVTRTGKDPA